MAEKFYSLLTNIGKAKIANSIGLGTKINFVKMKVGDGGGSYYEPTEDQTDLVHTVWEGNINHVEIDKDNPNWLNIQVMIPSDAGGFTIREYGTFDEKGNMLGICKCAESYKPVIADGSTKELLLNLVLAVTNTENVTLKIDPTIIFAKKSDVEQLRTDITAQLSDFVYQVAGGTSTVITLSMQTLVNGYAKTFIASANNAGAATTINGKKLYKPGTTNSPNLIKDKAYTVWYNSTGDCFFIKASAEGDADLPHVLATKKFSNDNDTGLIGSMPNNGVLSSSLNCGASYTIPLGYTSGGTITANSLASQTVASATSNQILQGITAWVNGVKVTGTIPSKAAATINPSTVAQTIAVGQYLSGDQTISATTGTANPVDVIAGKTFNSASGIGQTGTATIANLGGKTPVTGTLTTNVSGSGTATVGFQPSFAIVKYSSTVFVIHCPQLGVYGACLIGSSNNEDSKQHMIFTTTGFTFSNDNAGYQNTTLAFMCF